MFRAVKPPLSNGRYTAPHVWSAVQTQEPRNVPKSDLSVSAGLPRIRTCGWRINHLPNTPRWRGELVMGEAVCV